jgi:hypothetical protein
VVGEGEDVGYSDEMRKERRAYQSRAGFGFSAFVWRRFGGKMLSFQRLLFRPLTYKFFPDGSVVISRTPRRFLPLGRIQPKKRGGQSKIKNSTRIATKA